MSITGSGAIISQIIPDDPLRAKHTTSTLSALSPSADFHYKLLKSPIMSRDRFTAYAWTVLGYNLLVILSGALVRATGSVAACGNHWPTCNGEIIPRSPTAETLIEYTHRLTSAALLLMVVALLIWSRRAFPPGHRARGGAFWAMLFTLGEVAIGAGIVVFELAAEDRSPAGVLFIGMHLGNTLLLLAALASTAWWAGGGPTLALRGQGRRSRLAAAALAATLLMATGGAVAALGDTLSPGSSLDEAIHQVSLTSRLVIQLRASHPLIAVLVCLLLIYYIGTVRRQAAPREAKRFANLLNLAIFVQLFAGAINVMLAAPIPMQLLHLLLADLVWILLVLTCAANLARPEAGVDA